MKIESELLIDGRSVEVRCVDRLLQSDPYPGGHRYVLRLRAPDVHKRFPGLRSSTVHTPPREETEALFLDLLLALRDDWTGTREVRFLLNNITEVAIGEGEIKFSGICSDVVHPFAKIDETERDRI